VVLASSIFSANYLKRYSGQYSLKVLNAGFLLLFASIVRVIFEEILRPIAVVDTREIVAEHFRTAIRRRREEVHIVERYVTEPLRNGALKVASHLAAMHHGRINDYAGYGLLTLIIALALDLSLSAPS